MMEQFFFAKNMHIENVFFFFVFFLLLLLLFNKSCKSYHNFLLFI